MVMQNGTSNLPQVYVRTPLIESVVLREHAAGRKIFLKLENCQPSGSFKLRGISAQLKEAKKNGYTKTVIASDGNAGLAAAYSAMQLGLTCHIVTPHKTPVSIAEKMREFGATIEMCGDDEGEVRAKQIASMTSSALIQASDHELAWHGHSSIVDEIADDLGSGVVPSLIVTSCGGGGLVCGLVEGIRRHGWEKRTKILVMETTGTASFNAMVKARGERVILESVNSVAASLSEPQVIEKVSQCFLDSKPPLLSRLVTDKDAVSACVQFANDHRFLVGTACGTTLAAVYHKVVERLLNNDEEEYETIYDRIDHEDFSHSDDGPVVVIVDGGSEISLQEIGEYREKFGV